ncbi:hypothetical protein J2W28_004457 [Variovorax boronicumulans]|uniref:DUF4365 domain-containing protein n=1 Tax=Variovorax boronicumulans TaxID=436515 RepID=UPI00277D5EE0|nr:DUF4365 domain-containing protein [Variovorax boronicumulans]MDP9993841.1 hypothetical protein [Variovorax boronicumulans]MDQ0005295.1 hypothetical protein [Variovorax boronicumulans]
MEPITYPQYPSTYEMEDASEKLLRQVAPKNWLIKSAERRDMGIDGEVEIRKSLTRQVTGEHFKFQLKSTQRLVWREGMAKSNRIKVSTANYWLGLKVPVFLLQADLTANVIYFAAAGPQLRRMYPDLEGQRSIQLNLNQGQWIGGPDGLRIFESQYVSERGLTEAMGAAEHLLTELLNYAEFLEEAQGRDYMMEADPAEVDRLRDICERVAEVGSHLGEGPILSFDKAVELAEGQLGLGGDVHEYTVTHVCREVEQVMTRFAHSLLIRIHKEEGRYWEVHKPSLHARCARRLTLVEHLLSRTAILPPHKRREAYGQLKQTRV